MEQHNTGKKQRKKQSRRGTGEQKGAKNERMKNERMKITKETAERIDRIIKTDDLSVSVERKKVYILGEIAIILAGLLDAKFEERSEE